MSGDPPYDLEWFGNLYPRCERQMQTAEPPHLFRAPARATLDPAGFRFLRSHRREYWLASEKSTGTSLDSNAHSGALPGHTAGLFKKMDLTCGRGHQQSYNYINSFAEAIMFAGHLGAALAIGRAERRVNIGTFILAALLLDIVLWLFILLGWESASIPADFARTHQVKFIFPFSHGLLASIAWSVLAGAGVVLWSQSLKEGKWRCALFVGAAVFSHWLLDVLVHVPELPLVGAKSIKLGLGLWQNMPVALVVEGLLVALGLCMFVPGSGLSGARKIGIVALCAVVLVFTIAGMTIAPPPPSAAAMAGSSLATIVIVCGIASWIGKQTP